MGQIVTSFLEPLSREPIRSLCFTANTGAALKRLLIGQILLIDKREGGV